MFKKNLTLASEPLSKTPNQIRILSYNAQIPGGAAGWGHCATTGRIAGSIPDGVTAILH